MQAATSSVDQARAAVRQARAGLEGVCNAEAIDASEGALGVLLAEIVGNLLPEVEELRDWTAGMLRGD